MDLKKHSPDPPMTLGNMREQGVRNLIAYCRDAARDFVNAQAHAHR
jgi:hypothetical protein